MRTLSIPTPTHGRVLVEDAAASSVSRGLIVAFHGYSQSAEDMLEAVRLVPGAAAWTIASVQGLHRFYTRDAQRVIASWMTRQDRELAIADNVEYVNRVVERVLRRSGPSDPGPLGSPDRGTPGPAGPLVFLGFSQGASMAYRAAMLSAHEPAGVVALAGDVPPELKTDGAGARSWPPVLLATGKRDTWFTPDRLAADAAFFQSRGIPHESVVIDGGHEWTDAFRAVVGRWLTARCWSAP